MYLFYSINKLSLQYNKFEKRNVENTIYQAIFILKTTK